MGAWVAATDAGASGGAAAAAWGLAAALLGTTLALRGELRRRRELVARACHEVRGPLTAAHLALHGAARRAELPPTRAAALQLELRRAALAVDDLHGAGRGALTPRAGGEAVDLAALLSVTVATWDDVARAHGREVVLRGAPQAPLVRGDQLRLAQALGTVLANAIEHGGGRIEVSARADGERVRIEVADGGPGLPATVAELAARPRAGHGTRGRGLAIASTILGAHGGRLTGMRGGVALELPLVEGTT